MLYDAVEGLRAYLAASPLAWLFATVAVYLFSMWAYDKSGRRPIFHPILVAVVVLGGVLWAADIEYAVYFEGAQFIHFLLGPVTVLLAVPLLKSLHLIRRAAGPILIALVTGSLIASLPAVLLAYWLGADDGVMRSLVAKSVTTPIALGITESLGGFTPIAAVVVVFTGVLGGIIGGWVFKIGRVRDSRAMGLALGLTSHGIGVGRALQIDTTAGAFASLAMGLNGLITALWAPMLIPWLLGVLR
jgi:predicted murein hydrolase (TIGR00659 family)